MSNQRKINICLEEILPLTVNGFEYSTLASLKIKKKIKNVNRNLSFILRKRTWLQNDKLTN